MMPNLLGQPNPRREGGNPTPPLGGILPSIRTHYTVEQRTALHALAESRPDPITYAQERARILNYDRKTSERLEQR